MKKYSEPLLMLQDNINISEKHNEEHYYINIIRSLTSKQHFNIVGGWSGSVSKKYNIILNIT